jgi:hypothetical protein
VVAAALLAFAGEANAQPAPALLPRAELDYRVAPGLDCPSAADVRAEIVKQLDGDPFAALGAVVGRFHVAVTPKATEAIAIAVSFDDPTGKRSFETSFQGTPRSARTCSHLVRAHAVGEIVMELTFQMGRKYRALLTAGAACASSGSAPACNASRFDFWPEDWPRRLPKPTPDPPALPERGPLALRVGVAAWGEVVASGWGSYGFSAELGVRYRAVSASAEVHGDPPLGSVPFPTVGTVSFARLSGALLLCGHFGYFAGCGVADAGAFLFPRHTQGLPTSALYTALGVRAALEFPVVPARFFLRAAVDLRAPIRPASYWVMTTNIFEAAGLGVGLGLGALFEIAP